MWAHIVDGAVREVTEIDPEGRFHPSLLWVKCGKTVACGDLYEDGKFSKPAPYVPTDAEQRNSRRMAYVAESDPLFMAWQADPTETKKAAWLDKRAEIEARFPLSQD